MKNQKVLRARRKYTHSHSLKTLGEKCAREQLTVLTLGIRISREKNILCGNGIGIGTTATADTQYSFDYHIAAQRTLYLLYLCERAHTTYSLLNTKYPCARFRSAIISTVFACVFSNVCYAIVCCFVAARIRLVRTYNRFVRQCATIRKLFRYFPCIFAIANELMPIF